MSAIVLIFGLPLLLAAAMISPTDLSVTGLISCIVLVAVALPFIGWRTFLIAAIFPPPGESRSESLVRLWIGGTLMVVAVFYFIGAVFGYPPARVTIPPDAHLLIPFAPRFGLGIGLFCLSMLVSAGLWGVLAPLTTTSLVAPETVVGGALITGLVIFAVVAGLCYALLEEPTRLNAQMQASSPASSMTITSQQVGDFIKTNGLQHRFTAQDYLPTMRLDGFSCSIYTNGSYICSR
jgi:hypothetical protein